MGAVPTTLTLMEAAAVISCKSLQVVEDTQDDCRAEGTDKYITVKLQRKHRLSDNDVNAALIAYHGGLWP
jgi:hypothetical protein